jgi:hypothetical protein
MYSPKIDEALIPRLYRLRKLKKIPMTRLVNGILEKALSEMEKEGSDVSPSGSLADKEREATGLLNRGMSHP